MKKACMRLPSAIWTITYIVNQDGSAKILNFDKEDNDGYMFADTLGVLESIRESDDHGLLEEVTIDGRSYSVSNPQNIFTYKLPH